VTAPDWNQSAPGKLGVEHIDVGYAQGVVDASADVETLHFEARATGDVDIVDLYAGQGAQASTLPAIYNSVRRPMLVELVESGDEPWGALTYNDFSVTAVTGSSAMYNENLTQPVTISRLNAFDDGLFIAASAINAYVDLQFGTGAFGLDRHVLAVEVVVRGNLPYNVRRYDPGGLTVWNKEALIWSNGFSTGVTRFGEAIVQANEAFWRPWTPQMVRDFASGGSRKMRITCRAGAGYWRVDRVYLRVFSIPERRRGVGVGSPGTAFSWMSVTMDTPAGTGSPTATAGENLVLMARRITDYNVDNVAGAVLPWRHLRGQAADGTWIRRAQPFNPTVQTSANGVSGLMGAAGSQLDGIPCARIRDGATVIADTMPYALSRGAPVYGDQIVSQLMTIPAGTTVYGQVYVVAGWRTQDGRPAAPLRAEVFVDATDTRVLGAVEVTADDVARLPVSAPVSNTDDQGVTYKTVVMRFDDAVDLTTVLHRVQFSSPDSTGTVPWYVAALISDATTDDQTWAGGTDHAEGNYLADGVALPLWDSGVRSSDLLATLVEVPPAVTGVGARDGALTAHHVTICSGEAACPGCSEDTMPYAQVSWSPVPESDPDTVGYQVDRLDDLDPDWQRVASVAGRTTDAWNDLEPLIGVRTQYRVRALRSDGVVGDWSDPASITVPGGQVALAFSSNAATGMGCVYPEVWDREVVRDFTFREFDDVELRRMHGRNREVAFRPLERRGTGFTRRLLLAAGCKLTPVLPSMDLFQPLRDLAWAPIPYVCVRDGEGNRWYASLDVPEGTNRRGDAQGSELWTADIGIVEAADTPAVHDTSVAQVTAPASP
jgi:hypothetical protein